ncbi:hypothetical protein GCM10011511_49730 [Puia dinghuensis]|uniref:Uncharacterized protein n=1 Tax=Puia dinghuensis TaxID=1792502 RepID=A0A8J2UHZ2_9BACT|nr:hypothetical protein GCM10011511_49730 [Puia dinghuensis]
MNDFRRAVFTNCSVDSFSIFGENEKDDSVVVSDFSLGQLVFEPFTKNRGLLDFQEVGIPKGGALRIIRTDLGTTNFILCKFQDAILDFSSSKLTEIFVADTDFPEIVHSGGGIDHVQAQLAFGQFSTAFQRQGDTVRALEYQSREISAHFEQLSFFPSGFRSFSFTKVSLWLNKWSNDFGRNWGRGIAFTFASGVIFYLLLLWSANGLQLFFKRGCTGNLVASFLKFMNPLRFFETESLFKINADKPYLTPSPCSYIVDFISRIIIAYGFYQTIQAFRRFGRKP